MNNIRFEAVLRYVWKLNKEEIKKLKFYFRSRCSADDLRSEIDTTHTYKDFITKDGIVFEVEYLHCGYDDMDKNMVLSFRVTYNQALCICIVRPYDFENDSCNEAFYRAIPHLFSHHSTYSTLKEEG